MLFYNYPSGPLPAGQLYVASWISQLSLLIILDTVYFQSFLIFGKQFAFIKQTLLLSLVQIS